MPAARTVAMHVPKPSQSNSETLDIVLQAPVHIGIVLAFSSSAPMFPLFLYG